MSRGEFEERRQAAQDLIERVELLVDSVLIQGLRSP